ncbi:MAG: hypothetical protein MI864_26035 [Pseudomonadales bacterium]|nr:hypothetical protein [Pseudomonadales bacterium]
MTIVVFSDIDDTLMQTRRKCDSENRLQVGATDKTGEPLSFTTTQQRMLLDLLQHHEFIPVTGRNKAALDRVNLEFKSYKVIDHGALVLDKNDQIDPEWRAMLDQQIQYWSAGLEAYCAQVLQLIDIEKLQLRCRVISDFEYPCYISIKGDPAHMLALDEISCKFQNEQAGARVHINGQNMALLPPYASKENAVLFLQERYRTEHQGILFLALGDSHSDVPFMKTCHFKMIPQQSQIARELKTV